MDLSFGAFTMDLFSFIKSKFNTNSVVDERLQAKKAFDSEIGRRGTEESQQRAIYDRLTPNYDLHSTILDVRQMDRTDGIVKQVHSRTAKALTKGGLILDNPSGNEKLERLWKGFLSRCQLDNRLKLISDARGFIMEGTLPLQWVLNKDKSHIVRCIRMPTEQIRPIVGIDGQFENPEKAFAQYSYVEGRDIAFFKRWQLDYARLDPDNYDDMGSLGRPLLDATRKRFRQMIMTGDDSVIRRHVRAPQRLAHSLPGADPQELERYRKRVLADQLEGVENDFYMNKDGSVVPIEGDANLDQIKDISLIIDSWFAGQGMPKALLGIALDGISRDILDDFKQQWYDDLDTFQDSLTTVYKYGFSFEMLLNGMDAKNTEFNIRYAERSTESLSQRTDRALKLAALKASRHTYLTVAGLNPHNERELIKAEKDEDDPYPGDNEFPDLPGSGDVKITPSNARKKESATSISNQ